MPNSIVIFGTLIATAAVAAAEPPGLTAHVDTAPAPQAYLSIGGLGGIDGFFSAQAEAEAGYHLQGALWLHGLAATGGVGDDQGSGPVTQVRAGIEARTCHYEGIVCAYAGVDLGYQHMTWRSHDDQMAELHNDALANLRVGVDVGGKHMRVRSGLESYQLIAGNDSDHHMVGALMGLDLTLGVAYQW